MDSPTPTTGQALDKLVGDISAETEMMALQLTPEVTDEPAAPEVADQSSHPPAALPAPYEEVLVHVRDVEPLPDSDNKRAFRRYELTWRSRLEEFLVAEKLFSRDDIRGFIENIISNLSWLNQFRFEQWFTKTLVDYLVQRRCNSGANDRELWFNLEGMMVRFSIREFVLCSGLNVRKDYTDAELNARMGDVRLISQVYPHIKEDNVSYEKVSLKDLGAYLDAIHMEHPPSTDAAQQMDPDEFDSFAKLSLAFALGLLMFNHTGHNDMPAKVIQMCNDVEFCNRYNWGTEVFDECLKALRFENYTSHKSYSFNCFPPAISAWTYEALPQLIPGLTLHTDGRIPRVLAYFPKDKRITDAAVQDLLSRITHSRPTLHPTPAEEKTFHWQKYLEYVETAPQIYVYPLLTEKLGKRCLLYRGEDSSMKPLDMTKCRNMKPTQSTKIERIRAGIIEVGKHPKGVDAKQSEAGMGKKAN